MMRFVDTVEWGSGPIRTPNGSAHGGPTGLPTLGPVERPPRSSWTRFRGRWVTPVLAGLGLVGLVAAEFLPWLSLKVDDTSNNSVNPAFGSNLGVSSGSLPVGIDSINTSSAFAYHLGLFAMLALAGAVQFGRLVQRRRLAGFAVGLIAAQGLAVLSAIHSFGQLASLGLIGRPTAGMHTVIEPGTYLAIAGLVLILASVLLSIAPERVRVGLADAVREPDDGQYTDEPIELTVTQVKPLDEAHWTRPDPNRR
jgi:hypothetical protein